MCKTLITHRTLVRFLPSMYSVYVGVGLRNTDLQNIYHTYNICTVSHQYVYVGVGLSYTSVIGLVDSYIYIHYSVLNI